MTLSIYEILYCMLQKEINHIDICIYLDNVIIENWKLDVLTCVQFLLIPYLLLL